MKYFIYNNNKQSGPFEESDVEAKLRDGTFSVNDLACREGEKQWLPLNELFPLHAGTPHSWMRDSENLNSESPKPPPAYREPQHQTANPNFSQQPPFSQPMQMPQVQHVVHHHSLSETPEGSLPTIALVGGILCFSFMLLGLIPCLGWLNWFVLFGGGISKILGWITIFTVNNQSGKNKGIIGLVLTVIALFIGTIRLILGGGCL